MAGNLRNNTPSHPSLEQVVRVNERELPAKKVMTSPSCGFLMFVFLPHFHFHRLTQQLAGCKSWILSFLSHFHETFVFYCWFFPSSKFMNCHNCNRTLFLWKSFFEQFGPCNIGNGSDSDKLKIYIDFYIFRWAIFCCTFSSISSLWRPWVKPPFYIKLHHQGGRPKAVLLTWRSRKSKKRISVKFPGDFHLRWATTLFIKSAILICRTVDTKVSSSESWA